MHSAERLDSGHLPPPPPPTPGRNLPFIGKLKPFYLLSILVLLLAISFSISKTDQFKKLFFLRSNLLNPTVQKQISRNPIYTAPYCVLWMAPFLSGGGYSSEAWSYILALHNYSMNKNPVFNLKIEQHGDLENLEFWEGLPLDMRNLAIELYHRECKLNETVVVCHSEPGAWYPPLFDTLPCPPIGYGHFKAVVGRTMFETDRVNDEHVKRCNLLDFVWVPTDFHVKTFTESGVDPLKIVKIVQPVDLDFFDPVKYEALNLGSIGNLVMGSFSNGEKFVFLSIFKWEYRKGWDVLLRSYLKEFSGGDDVVLYLLTNPYHSDRDFGNKIVEYVEKSDLEEPKDGWARVYVIDEHIAQVDMPRLYKAANAFVLPSRGEGWGRPIVEAMAMTLPVIATNWSGPTEFMTEDNSYPLPVNSMSEVTEGPFKGHLWAEPSINKLQMLMRHVMRNHEEAKARDGDDKVLEADESEFGVKRGCNKGQCIGRFGLPSTIRGMMSPMDREYQLRKEVTALWANLVTSNTDGPQVSITEGDHICCQYTQYSVKPHSQQLILKRSSRKASKRAARCTKQRAATLKSEM